MIASFENAKLIIESKDKIGILPCNCTVKEQATQESPCKQKIDVCMAFDFYAEYVIEGLGKGRSITKQEALDIIKQSIVKLFPVPGEIVLNNFYVNLNTE